MKLCTIITPPSAAKWHRLSWYAGRPLYHNPNWEVNANDWISNGYAGGTGSIARDTGTTRGSSAGSLKVTHSNGSGTYRAQQGLHLITGRKYTFSVWVYIPSADVPSTSVKLITNGFTNESSDSANLGTTDSWQELTFSGFDPGADEYGRVRLEVDDAAGGGGAFVYFDDLTITVDSAA